MSLTNLMTDSLQDQEIMSPLQNIDSGTRELTSINSTQISQSMTCNQDDDEVGELGDQKSNQLLDLNEIKDRTVLSQSEREKAVALLLNSKGVSPDWIVDQLIHVYYHATKPNPKTGELIIDYNTKAILLKEMLKLQKMYPRNQQGGSNINLFMMMKNMGSITGPTGKPIG